MLKLYNGLHIWINTEHEAWLWGGTVPSVTRPSVQSVAAVEMNYWSGLKSPHETWRAAWISGSGPERLQGTNELCVIIAPSNHLSPFKSIKIVWKMTLSTRHTLIPTLLTVAHTRRFTWLALQKKVIQRATISLCSPTGNVRLIGGCKCDFFLLQLSGISAKKNN